MQFVTFLWQPTSWIWEVTLWMVVCVGRLGGSAVLSGSTSFSPHFPAFGIVAAARVCIVQPGHHAAMLYFLDWSQAFTAARRVRWRLAGDLSRALVGRRERLSTKPRCSRNGSPFRMTRDSSPDELWAILTNLLFPASSCTCEYCIIGLYVFGMSLSDSSVLFC